MSKKVEFSPVKGLVVIEPINNDEKTESGIYLPAHAEVEVSNIAKITHAHKDDSYKKGQTILYRPYGFDEIVLNDKRLFIGKVENILGEIKQC